MQRREFIGFIGGAAAAWPLTAGAQKPAIPIIGFLESGNYTAPAAAFHAGLKELGFVEGQNVTIEFRKADAQFDRLPAFAADLVARQVAVVVASGAIVSPLAARAATTTIPIVFLIGADPIKYGLVTNLNHPNGNITGVTTFGTELFMKRVQLLLELIPNARAIAMLVNPKNPTHLVGKAAWQKTADMIGMPVESVSASSESDFEPAIASLAGTQADAVVVTPDVLFTSYRANLAAVLARHAMPAMFIDRESAVAGGLIAYGASYTDAAHQAGIYTGRVLKGDKPADLPVLQPTKFDLAINLKASRALGLAIPESLLVQATEVIE